MRDLALERLHLAPLHLELVLRRRQLVPGLGQLALQRGDLVLVLPCLPYGILQLVVQLLVPRQPLTPHHPPDPPPSTRKQGQRQRRGAEGDLRVGELELQLDGLRRAQLGAELGHGLLRTCGALQRLDRVHQHRELRRGVGQAVLQALVLARGQVLGLARAQLGLARPLDGLVLVVQRLLDLPLHKVEPARRVARLALDLPPLHLVPLALPPALGQLFPHLLQL